MSQIECTNALRRYFDERVTYRMLSVQREGEATMSDERDRVLSAAEVRLSVEFSLNALNDILVC